MWVFPKWTHKLRAIGSDSVCLRVRVAFEHGPRLNFSLLQFYHTAHLRDQRAVSSLLGFQDSGLMDWRVVFTKGWPGVGNSRILAVTCFGDLFTVGQWNKWEGLLRHHVSYSLFAHAAQSSLALPPISESSGFSSSSENGERVLLCLILAVVGPTTVDVAANLFTAGTAFVVPFYTAMILAPKREWVITSSPPTWKPVAGGCPDWGKKSQFIAFWLPCPKTSVRVVIEGHSSERNIDLCAGEKGWEPDSQSRLLFC